jgi:hypothetical protein
MIIVGLVLPVLPPGISLMLGGKRREGIKARRRRASVRKQKNADLDRDRAQEANEKLHRQLDGDPDTHSSGAIAFWLAAKARHSGEPHSKINDYKESS